MGIPYSRVCIRFAIVPVVAMLFSDPLLAQEICGLQSVAFVDAFKHGFETGGSAATRGIEPVEASSAASTPDPTTPVAPVTLGRPMGVAKAILGILPPTVTITSPSPSAIIAGNRVQVRGTFTGPENTGIRVNEMTAYIEGNEFVTPDIRVGAGTFDLVATATTMDGLTTTATQTVTGGSPASAQVSFGTGPVAGLSELIVPFTLEIAGSVLPQSVSIDFDGDSTPDYSGGVPTAAQLRHRYTEPGIYRARATVTSGASGNPLHIADRFVVVVDLTPHRNRICSPYGALRTRLDQNDIPAALRVFPSNRREPMQALFTAMGTNLPTMAARLGTIGNGIIGLTEANLMLISVGSPIPVGYPLQVARGADGVWRIEGL